MMFFTGKKNITGKTSLFLQRKRNYFGMMGNGFVILKRPMMQYLLSTVLNPLNFLPGNAVVDTKERKIISYSTNSSLSVLVLLDAKI